MFDVDDNNGGNNDFNNLCVELESFPQYFRFFNNNDNKANNFLRVFHTNVRSYSKNFEEVLVYLELFHYNLDVIVLSECWLGSGGGVSGIDINGFNLMQSSTFCNQNFNTIFITTSFLFNV